MPSATSRPIEPVEIDLYIPDDAAVAHAHDRSLAELLFDLAQGLRECFLAIFIHYSCRHQVELEILLIYTVLFHESRANGSSLAGQFGANSARFTKHGRKLLFQRT